MLCGGIPLGPQLASLTHPPHVVVGTPGRIQELAKKKALHLRHVRTLVLDEADRMLDMGFEEPIRDIVKRVPPSRQGLLFSATFEPRIKAMALEFMRDPKQVQVAANSTIAETIAHRAHPVDNSRKRDLLVELLSKRHTDQVLVFGKTKHGCNRLAEQLAESGLPSVAIHGNKSQAQRQKALDMFKSGRARILVATDVAARGLDIPNLPLVINHDLPMVAEDYVHRIGRTGRNGASGEALSLVSPEEGGLLRQIQRMLNAEISMDVVEGFAPSQPVRLDAPIPKNGGGQRRQPSGGRPGARMGEQKPGGERAPRKAAGHRGHGKPADRSAHAHAGPKQHRAGAGRAQGGAATDGRVERHGDLRKERPEGTRRRPLDACRADPTCVVISGDGADLSTGQRRQDNTSCG